MACVNAPNEFHFMWLCQPGSPAAKEEGQPLAGAKQVFYVQSQLNASTRRDNFDVTVAALSRLIRSGSATPCHATASGHDPGR